MTVTHINAGIDCNEFLDYYQKAMILELPDPIAFAIGCCLDLHSLQADLAGISDKARAKMQSVVDLYNRNAVPGKVLAAWQQYRAMNPMPGYNGVFNPVWC